MPLPQNDISAQYFTQQNLEKRLAFILDYLKKQTAFKTLQLLQKSAWWNSTSIGAAHYSGTYRGQPAILKIQGVKPNVSEAKNIKNFTDQNQSQLVRPPRVYFSLPWHKELQFEALVLENLEGKKLVGLPASRKEIQTYFAVYQEYRQKCLNRPWLKQPSQTLSEGVAQSFTQWKKIRRELFPNGHPLIEPTDVSLIDRAVEVLTAGWQQVDWQFQHGHFSTRDIFLKNKQYVLLSNLYWSWRAPYYDAVFGWHWYQFDLASKPDVTIKQLKQHRKRWQTTIAKTVQPKNSQEKRLLELAFLERAAAGLNLDGLITPSPTTAWLMDTLRAEIRQLL